MMLMMIWRRYLAALYYNCKLDVAYKFTQVCAFKNALAWTGTLVFENSRNTAEYVDEKQ